MNLTNFLLSTLVIASPLLAGPIVLWTKEEVVIFHLLDNYTRFFALFLSWALFRKIAIQYLISRGKTVNSESSLDSKITKQKTYRIFLFAVSLLLVLLFLQLFRSKSADYLFFLTLIALSLAALAESFQHRKLFLKSLICFCLYYATLSYLSIILTVGIWVWQPILFGLAISANVTLLWASKMIANWTIEKEAAAAKKSVNGKKRKGKAKTVELLSAPFTFDFFSKLYPSLLMLAPFFVGLLCYARALSTYYLAIFIILPLTTKVVSNIKKATDYEELPSSLHQTTIKLCSLYVVLLLLCGLL